MDSEGLRRAAIGSTAVAIGAALALALLFGVLLEPGGQDGGSCTTGLYPGTYADLLLPVHLAALGALAAALWMLGRRLGIERPTAVALGVAAVYVAVCLAYRPAFGPYALATLFLSIPVSVALALGLALQVAAGRREPPEQRWLRFARVSWAGQLAGLFVLLPAAYSFAWLNGAGIFCF